MAEAERRFAVETTDDGSPVPQSRATAPRGTGDPAVTVRPTRTTVAGRAYLDLQNLARRTSRPTDELHQVYALEGFLARLSQSPYADKLVLKGGVLLAAYAARRPTRDVDLQADGSRMTRIRCSASSATSPPCTSTTAWSSTRRAPARTRSGTTTSMPECGSASPAVSPPHA
ncbi:hypothetical protein DKT69_18825 [Micromonospora sicca]|uniref:Nucleotidyl transferase AbiEii/AbiGii toxin family protein n=1 Tax=Micromonospora sicca TaxID=2202420 RepID=A0A317DGJ7_9ACTN|nr:hypothetical protein DKT69_18825 [Micromonospora sp. 4G51]